MRYRTYLGLPPLLAWPALIVMIIVVSVIFAIFLALWSTFVLSWYGVSVLIEQFGHWRGRVTSR